MAHVQACASQKESKPRKRSVTPKITPLIPKMEVDGDAEVSNHSSDTNHSKNPPEMKSVNKRKRKGPLVIRNESPEIKDEAEVLWSNAAPQNAPPLLDPSQIKKELEELPLTIDEPPAKKKKLKKSKDGTEIVVTKDIDCPLCPKKVSDNVNLKRHISMFHFRQNRFACKKCEYRGYRRIDTINHLNNVHGIQGEKEITDPFIEIAVKEEDLCGPINTKVKCDPNLTFNSVIASLGLDISVPGETSTSSRRGRKSKNISSQSLELPEIFEEPKMCKDESGNSSGMSSPTSDNLMISDSERRPTRNRIKPVRKDFVYDLNKIIKQEAEVHREHQHQQQLLYPARTRARKSIPNPDQPKSDSDFPDKENLDEKSIKISEVYGAALKMARIEVMNQRACFHKPPEIPAERPFVPTKISTPLRSDEKVIKDVPALLKATTVKRGRKRTTTTEVKRVPSFTDQFLSNNGTDKKFKARQETEAEPIAIFPTMAPVPALRTLKASKKSDLSSKEKSQLEMLQRLRNDDSLEIDGSKRKSSFPQKPNIEV